MIKKWSIKITICSVSGVVHMRWLMRRQFVFKTLMIINIFDRIVRKLICLKFVGSSISSDL